MHKNILRAAFPPPELLSMPAIGLEVSDRFLRFTKIEPIKTGLGISIYGEIPLKEGIVSAGKIEKPEELTKALTVLKEKLDTSFVYVSLPEEHSYLTVIRLPYMKNSEIRGSIELQIADVTPFSVQDAIFDYDIIKKNKARNFIEVSLSVFPRSMIELYLSVLKGAGLMPVAFEIESAALARTVIGHGDKGTYMIMNMGSSNAKISIVSEGVVQFTTTISVGGTALTNAIEKALKVSPAEVEAIKAKGIAVHKQNEELFMSLVSIVAMFRDEIYKYYAYWQNHGDSGEQKKASVEKVILCGEGVTMPDFVEYLSIGLEIPVEVADIMININSLDDYIPALPFDESLRFTTPIGLALQRYF